MRSISCESKKSLKRVAVDWKPRLRNYKSHIKEKLRSCSIVNRFIDVCSDIDDPSRKIRIIIIDQLQKGNLLLQNERFWITTLVTIHKGLNSTHDWNRKCGTERPKQK